LLLSTKEYLHFLYSYMSHVYRKMNNSSIILTFNYINLDTSVKVDKSSDYMRVLIF